MKKALSPRTVCRVDEPDKMKEGAHINAPSRKARAPILSLQTHSSGSYRGRLHELAQPCRHEVSHVTVSLHFGSLPFCSINGGFQTNILRIKIARCAFEARVL